MNKIISTIIVTAVIAVAIGYWLGYGNGYGVATASGASKIALANKLFPSEERTLVVNGTVFQVSGQGIALKNAAAPFNPLATDVPTDRQVYVNGSTKITKILVKDVAEYKAEMLAFQKAASGNKFGFTVPPSPFGEVELKLSDIKAGDRVTVSSATDILSAANITATGIQVSGI